MNRQRKADLLLVMITAFWGVSYFLIDLCMTVMTPMSLNAFRFLVGFAVLVLFYRRKMWPISRATLKNALTVSLTLAAVYLFLPYGVKYTSITNAGFLCGLPVVTTPILEFFIWRKKPGKKLFACLLLCLVGMAMLTLNDAFKPALGDLLCLGVAVFYGLDLVVTDRAVRQEGVDPLQMGILRLGFVGVITLVLAAVVEEVTLPTTPEIWGGALFLAVFCTGIAFLVQTVQQQYTTPSHVGLIFTLEPLFSAVVAFFWAGERQSPAGYVGAGLMMLSLVIMEADWGALKKRTK